MAGGSLSVTAATYAQLEPIAQRILCWVANGNKPFVRVVSSTPVQSIVVPEERFGVGSLVLRRGGTDLVAGYVAGSHVSYTVTNGNVAVTQNPNTCPASTNQPTIISMATNVGGNPLAVTLNYANFAGAGTVNIAWGDGTFTLGAAESAAALAHTYPNASSAPYLVTVTDASDATQTASAWFVVQ